MSLPRSVADILREHVTLEVESIDRMYLNVYVPGLQYESGVAAFFRKHRWQPFASSALMNPISKAFVAAIHAFVEAEKVPLITFEKGQRKDDVMAERLRRFTAPGGVVFVGRAQEKTVIFRTEKRHNPGTGAPYPWLVRSTAMVNHFYGYAVDRDFGPFFLKFGTYFPYNAKLCLNGHEYVKRQLAQRGIAHEALDNGLLSCADPQRGQALCDVTYDLRRLRLYGLIERQPKHHRYRVTDAGLRLALFLPRVWARTVRPGLATVMPDVAPNDLPLRRAFARVEEAMDDWCAQAKLVA